MISLGLLVASYVFTFGKIKKLKRPSKSLESEKIRSVLVNWTWPIGPVKQPNSIEFGFQTLDLQRFKTRSGSRKTVRHKDPFGRINGREIKIVQ